MVIERIEPNRRMGAAVIHGDTSYLSGQVAKAATVGQQTRLVLRQIEALLGGAGSSKS